MLYMLCITALQLKYYSPPPLKNQDTKLKGVKGWVLLLLLLWVHCQYYYSIFNSLWAE